MDQFIISLGKKNNALLIDCRSLEYEHVPVDMTDLGIIISNTKVSRKLVDSAYNRRRDECTEGVETLKKFIGNDITQLRDVSVQQFEKYKNTLPDIISKRCEHVVYEDDRVLKSKTALINKKFDEFGKLMVQSHNSLRDLYGVSCTELDLMVELALNQYDIYGSRMTGAGFGGCTVSIVKKYGIKKFVDTVHAEYVANTGIEPEFYVCSISNGVTELQNGGEIT
jgi:galactokinase